MSGSATKEIEADESGMGHLTLWAEVLKCAVEDVSGGIRIGALTADLRTTGKEFIGNRAVRAMDALEAAVFLKSAGGVRLCDMFRCNPEWVLRRCRERAREREGRSNIRPVKGGPIRGPQAPKHDVAGWTVKTWTAIRTTGQSTSEGCLWLCRCHLCGNERNYPGRRIKNGRAGPCGCQSKAASTAADAAGRVPGGECLHCGAAFERAGAERRIFCSARCKGFAGRERRKAEGHANETRLEG